LFITALLSTNDRAATATVEKGGAFILALAKEDFDTHMGSRQGTQPHGQG